MLVLQKASLWVYTSLPELNNGKNPQHKIYFLQATLSLRCIISSTQFIGIIRLSTLVLLFMPWFYTDNHFSANPPSSQPDINMLQTCNPLQIAERGCKMILWGHWSLHLVSTLPLQAPPAPAFNFRQAFVHGGIWDRKIRLFLELPL